MRTIVVCCERGYAAIGMPMADREIVRMSPRALTYPRDPLFSGGPSWILPFAEAFCYHWRHAGDF
jgi:hypothetical protein